MTQVLDLHREAMQFADLAVEARRQGDLQAAEHYFHRAFEQERAAAGLVASLIAVEPTRSVLHRSAAALALECGEYSEAARLISIALEGNPPAEIVEELRRVRKQLAVKAPHLSFEEPVAREAGVERFEVLV